MNLGSVVKNPVVWGGGAVLGVLIMLRSSSANANVSANMDAVNPTIVSANVAMNSASLGAEIEKAKIAASLGATMFSLSVQNQAHVLHMMENMDNNNTLIARDRMETNAGITNALIASSTAIIVDQANNNARLGLAWQETARAEIGADRDVSLAYYQYKAAKAVSKNNMIGTIAGSVTKVAGAAIQAFA